MFIKSVRFLGFAILLLAIIFPATTAAASTSHAVQDNVLSDGQFVYGPNVGSFNLKGYLGANAAHLAKYADDLYGRSEYYSINPKIYLTLLEIHSRLLSAPTPKIIENPFGIENSSFIAQIDYISNKMVNAYYSHLYNDSAVPVTERSLKPFILSNGSAIQAIPTTNAGTYAIIAGLAAINAQNLSVVLDNNQVNGFYQTYQRLFKNDDPLDETNHIGIPETASALAAPVTLLQLPYARGLAWKFGGVHDTSGCSGLGASGCDFTDGSALDFYPNGATWGMDTSSMLVVASGAGIPTRVSNCYFKILHSDGWETAYYHLENTQTYSGAIAQNTVIGVIANTQAEATCNGGGASGPHVHFWLRHNGANVAINGTALTGWSVHSGRWSYDTDHNYMWLERNSIRKYPYSDTILSEAPPIVNTTTSISSNAEDGLVLESTESSNLGSAMNATNLTLRLGDDAAKKQYRSILSFSTGSLPDTAVITGILLKLKKQGVVGGVLDPVTAYQGFKVDIKTGSFGTSALQTIDFQTAANQTYGPFKPALTNNFYIINLTNGKTYINKLATNGGLTQIRLRFELDDNNNAVANYLSLYSGNAAAADRPQLVFTYYVP